MIESPVSNIGAFDHCLIEGYYTLVINTLSIL